jgi:hypothetical protein
MAPSAAILSKVHGLHGVYDALTSRPSLFVVQPNPLGSGSHTIDRIQAAVLRMRDEVETMISQNVETIPLELVSGLQKMVRELDWIEKELPNALDWWQEESVADNLRSGTELNDINETCDEEWWTQTASQLENSINKLQTLKISLDADLNKIGLVATLWRQIKVRRHVQFQNYHHANRAIC